MRAFPASLVVAFALLSTLVGNGTATRMDVTGTVVQFQPGESISVTNESTDPTGVEIALRDTTVFEEQGQAVGLDPETIMPGVGVTVWYRSVGERRPVAETVRVLPESPDSVLPVRPIGPRRR